MKKKIVHILKGTFSIITIIAWIITTKASPSTATGSIATVTIRAIVLAIGISCGVTIITASLIATITVTIAKLNFTTIASQTLVGAGAATAT